MAKKINGLLIGFLLIQFTLLSQIDSTVSRHSFAETGGLVSYYFWSEDSIGTIIEGKIDKPFIKNYSVLINEHSKIKSKLDSKNLERLVNVFAHDVSGTREKSHFEFQDSIKKEKIIFGLKREICNQQKSVVFIQKNSVWKSVEVKKVVYFNIDKNNQYTFSHTSDSIILTSKKVAIPSNGAYTVFTFLKENNDVKSQIIYSYSGENVTSFFNKNTSIEPKRVILFINGYRGPTREKDETDHLVISKDRYHYWFKVDDEFINRLTPDKAYYLDGSMSIRTSNHKTMTRFARSMFFSTYIFRKKKARSNYNRLNIQNNAEGFAIRKQKGQIGGKALLTALCNSPICNETKDTIDIVCHSMGYAYSLGLIEEIKNNVIFGRIYILAPENACQDGADWSIFEEVWQYGSNLDQKNADPVWEQDGIAPQCAVKGIEQLDSNKGGRAFFPEDWNRKNFIDSHMLYNYDWIFDRIKKGEIGFIGK